MTKAQFGEETTKFYTHGIDAIYHPRTTKIVLPANALISEAICSLYRSAYYRGRRRGVGRGSHMLTKTLPPPSDVIYNTPLL